MMLVSVFRFSKPGALKKQFSDIGLETTAVLVIPPSLSLPRMGGGNAVAPLFTPLTLHSRSRLNALVHRQASIDTVLRYLAPMICQ